MKDEVRGGGEQMQVSADGFAHTTLDSIALNGVSKDTASREADTRAGRGEGLNGVEPGHRGRELLAPCFINPLIVGVFAQAPFFR